MVVAVKRDEKIVVGITMCDSFVDMSEKDLTIMENIPFWKVKGPKDCYVFAEDLTYAVDLLRYNDSIFQNITDGNSIISNVVPKIKEILGKYSRIIGGKEWGTQLLIIKGNKMFTIGNYFTVSEADEFVGLGFESYLRGSVDETSELSPSESILFAVRGFNRMRSRNFFPMMLYDHQTKKRKIYYK